jgi:ornithine cyclodeaminase/alanine dehydrogenase-like protein (mu-crystallin family)
MAASAPLFLDARAVAAGLPWPALIDALQAAFRAGDATVPERLHYQLGNAQTGAPVLLVMPAWSEKLGVGTKLVSVFPDNHRLGLPSIHGLYLLMDPANGRPLAVLDGGELTARRTAAASALASRSLSRADSRCLLMVGTGRLAHCLPLAHATTRPIDRVLVWGRSLQKAERTAQALRADGLKASAIASLPDAVAQADIVSCATLSNEPLLQGDWLRPGTHVDLVGAFTPGMRETDDRVFARAQAVWCDTRDGALAEAGDILQAVESGAFDPQRIAGDLAALCRSDVTMRRHADDITVFKSVGMALEDLAAACLCVSRQARPS